MAGCEQLAQERAKVHAWRLRAVEAEAERDRWRKAARRLSTLCRNQLDAYAYGDHWQERAEAAEAEVERLRGALERCVADLEALAPAFRFYLPESAVQGRKLLAALAGQPDAAGEQQG